MKKLIVTILAVFYLGVSSGATVHLHYCMGQLIEWGFTKDEAKKCGNCGMKRGNSEDCCKDRHYQLKAKDSAQVTAIVYHFNTLGVIIPSTTQELLERYNSSIDENKPVINSPPRTRATAAFILNCSFRI